MEHDKLSTRLGLILQRFNNGERLSLKELAREFGVGVRTIQRDLHERLAFMPIKKENGKYFLEPYALGKLSFKDIQNFAALSGINALYPKLDSGFIAELLSAKMQGILQVKNQGFERVDYEEFERIGEAILAHKIISLDYKGKRRVLKPYKLVNNSGIWYVLAEEEGKLKHFTLAKIARLEIGSEEFVPNEGLKEEIAKNGAKWIGDFKEVVLEIDNKSKEYFFRKPIFGDFEVVEENDEFFTIRAKFAYDDEILHLVKQWIPYIRILEPSGLREKLNVMLRDYLNLSNMK